MIIGMGLALYPIHNAWLAKITSIHGEAVLFLPAFGAVVWILATLFFLRDNWKRIEWGSKTILIPLLIIGVSMAVSGFVHYRTPTDMVSPLFMAAALFSTYLVGRILGPTLFKLLIPFVLLGTLIAIILEIVSPGNLSGGLITNSAACAGFLIFGALINQGKHQWILCLVALVGVLLIGTLEGLFIVAVIGLFILLRKDVNHKLLIVIGIVLAFIIIGAVIGLLTPIFRNTYNLDTLYNLIIGKYPINTTTMDLLTTGRWTIMIDAMRNFSWLGHGFTLDVNAATVHNIPLIIVDQIGIPAALAWTFVTLYCLIKTKWKYIWVLVIAASIWDHYFWTQFMPWYWCLIGISLASNIKSDLILRKDKREETQNVQQQTT
jgi:hypothetical protein